MRRTDEEDRATVVDFLLKVKGFGVSKVYNDEL